MAQCTIRWSTGFVQGAIFQGCIYWKVWFSAGRLKRLLWSCSLQIGLAQICISHKCADVIFGDYKETVTEIQAEYDSEKKIHKGVLHWVAEPSPGVDPLKVEVRLLDKLFLSENPANLGDDWLHDLNSHSKTVIPDTYGVPSLQKATVGDSFQFERLAMLLILFIFLVRWLIWNAVCNFSQLSWLIVKY